MLNDVFVYNCLECNQSECFHELMFKKVHVINVLNNNVKMIHLKGGVLLGN